MSDEKQDQGTSTALESDCRVVAQWDLADLTALIRGKILALRWPEFCDEAACRQLAERLASSSRLEPYSESSVWRIGMPYFEATTLAKKESYYSHAEAFTSTLRSLSWPLRYPIDSVRAMLSTIWSPGVEIEQVEARRMFAGIVRVFGCGAEARPHQDVLDWDLPSDSPFGVRVAHQLAANVYIETSMEGGELELWDVGFSRKEYEKRRTPGPFVLDRLMLPQPVLLLKPSAGDLIMFNSRNIHAVRAVASGRRITASCFVGIRDYSMPLTLWS